MEKNTSLFLRVIKAPLPPLSVCSGLFHNTQGISCQLTAWSGPLHTDNGGGVVLSTLKETVCEDTDLLLLWSAMQNNMYIKYITKIFLFTLL